MAMVSRVSGRPNSGAFDSHAGLRYFPAVDFTSAAGKVLKVVNKIGEGIHEVIANEELAKRVDRVPSKLGPYGVDAFVFDPE